MKIIRDLLARVNPFLYISILIKRDSMRYKIDLKEEHSDYIGGLLRLLGMLMVSPLVWSFWSLDYSNTLASAITFLMYTILYLVGTIMFNYLEYGIPVPYVTQNTRIYTRGNNH